jgi:hypothetical protein
VLHIGFFTSLRTHQDTRGVLHDNETWLKLQVLHSALLASKATDDSWTVFEHLNADKIRANNLETLFHMLKLV